MLNAVFEGIQDKVYKHENLVRIILFTIVLAKNKPSLIILQCSTGIASTHNISFNKIAAFPFQKKIRFLFTYRHLFLYYVLYPYSSSKQKENKDSHGIKSEF